MGNALNKPFRFGVTLVRLTGMILLLYALFLISLGLFGKSAIAQVTVIRRIGGERNEVIPNRYTYGLAYHFTVDGQSIEGSTTWISNPIFLSQGVYPTLLIRYIAPLPFLNQPDQATQVDIGKLALIGFGSLLTFIPLERNEKKKVRKS